MAVTIERPNAARPRRKGVNWEKIGWMYMRFSGVILLFLIFGHLFVNLFLGDGIKQIDFAFVGGKLSDPFWQVWDFFLLTLAFIHGGNGVRTLINDYVTSPRLLKALKVTLFTLVAAMIVLGTLVIVTFDPCPAGAPADLLASFCSEL